MTDRTAAHVAEASAKPPLRPGFSPGRRLSASLLYRRCDPAELPFQLCSDSKRRPG